MKVELQTAYLLNAKPYLESSLLLEVFTKDYGRIAMVARGAKRAKFAQLGVLQAFNQLLLSWCGKGSLYTMTQVELAMAPSCLMAKKLIMGLYLNELLVRLLAIGDPHPEFFACYQQTLQALAVEKNEQIILRIFEKRLLMAIGYALPLLTNNITGEQVVASKYYFFDLEQGPQAIDSDIPGANKFKGSSLLALAKEKFVTKEELLEAKCLLRAALALRLGEQPLYSRKLLL